MSLTVGELVAYLKVDTGNSEKVLANVAAEMGKVETAALKAEKAELSLTQAKTRLESASARTVKAEQNLAAARASGNASADKIAKAEEALTRAKTAEQSASLKVKQAEQGVIAARQKAKTATEALTKAVDESTVSTSKLSKALAKVSEHEGNINTLSSSAGRLGLVLTAAAAASVTMATNFNKGMSNVKATGEDAAKNFDSLRQAAIDAGADTAYSATESAGAIEELSKAGVTAKDILGGALSGSLDLAAAGELGVADAAGIASIAMTQFGLTGEDVGHVADLLAAGAGKAMGSVQDLGEGLKQGGLVASATNMTLEETVAALSAFASAGLLGSDAGTSMKTMLQALQNPSKKASVLMDELGISLYDANGQFAGLVNLAGQLETGMGSMTQAQRDAAMATIFGSDAVRAANVLYDQGATGITDWIEKVDDSGYAAKTAATRMDNLAGDLEKLGGSFETLMIDSGDGATSLLRSMVQTLDGVVSKADEVPNALKQGALMVVGPAGLATLGVAGFGKLVTSIGATTTAIKGLNWSLKTTSLSAGAIGVALAVGTAALASWAQKAAEAKQRSDDYAGSLDDASGSITNYTREIAAKNLQEAGAFELANKIGISVQTVTDAALGNEAALKKVTEATDAYYDVAAKRAENFDLKDTFSNLWGDTDLDKARKDTEALSKAIGLEKDAIQSEVGAHKERKNAVQDSEETAKKAEQAVQALATAQEGAATAVSEATQKWLDSIHDVADESIDLISAYDQVVDANRAQAESAAEATKSTKDSWEDFYDGTTVGAKAWIKQLEEQVDAYDAWGDNLTEVQERLTKALPDGMQEAGVALVQELQDLGPAGAAKVQDLVDASDKELRRLVDLSQQAGGDAADQLANEINNARPAEFRYELKLVGESLQTIQATIAGAGEDLADWTISADGTTAINEATQTVLKINEETGEITILGENTKALQAAAIAKQTADGTTGTIKIDGDTEAARAALAAFRAQVQTSLSIPLVAKGVGVQTARATGGAIHGPGTGTSDDIPAWLSNGEHVVTAAEVQAMGGHASVEKWRRMALAGDLPAFAYGGAVTTAQDSLARVQKKIDRQKKVVAGEKADVKSAQKTYDNIDGTKENRSKKKSAKANLDKQKKELKAEQKELDDLVEQRRDIKAQIERLKDDSSEATTDVRRGNIIDDVTEGLSGALGVIDDLYAQADNKDLSKKKRKAAREKAEQLEKDLTKAYGKAERLEAKLDQAKSDLSELSNIQAGVKSVLGGEFKLSDSIKAATEDTETLIQKTNKAGDVWYETQTVKGKKASVTAKDILANAQAKAAAFEAFTGKLDKLAALGISGVILAEIANEGLEGGTLLADALLADPATAKKLNGAYEDIDRWTTAAGASATKNTTVDGTFYANGVDQATQRVENIEAALTDVYDTIEQLAGSAESAILSALGLKKDKNGKVVAKAQGGPIVGPGTGTSDDIPALLSNGEHVWTAAEVQAAGGHSRVEGLRRAALLHDLPGFKDGGSVQSKSTPIHVMKVNAAPTQDITVVLPTLYVQSPITGEYLEAHFEGVADKRIKVAVATARKGY